MPIPLFLSVRFNGTEDLDSQARQKLRQRITDEWDLVVYPRIIDIPGVEIIRQGSYGAFVTVADETARDDLDMALPETWESAEPPQPEPF